jgi:hypothetical protein
MIRLGALPRERASGRLVLRRGPAGGPAASDDGGRKEAIVKKSKDSFSAGDKVPETGQYLCEICNTEGGVHDHRFRAGEEFPQCMNCGCSTSWRKSPKTK